MNTVAINYSLWHKYISRILLVTVLMVFVGCDDPSCASDTSSVCGETVLITKGSGFPVHLTEESPTLRIITDAACACGGTPKFMVAYQYQDIPNSSEMTAYDFAKKEATEKDRPSVVVKFGTLEKGAQNDVAEKPNFSQGWWWVKGIGAPPKFKEGTNPPPVHYVLSITMQKPMIRLPGKGPTITVPGLGTIVGPKPRDIDLHASLSYETPLPAKDKK